MRAAHRVCVALICGAYLTGCGTPANAGRPALARPSHPSTSPRTGVVEGRVLRPPGRDPRSGAAGGTPGPLSEAKVPVNGDPVEAHDARGHIVGRAVTVPRGRFRMTLAPGTYRIIEGICGVSKRVAVHGGTTTPVTLAIPNAC